MVIYNHLREAELSTVSLKDAKAGLSTYVDEAIKGEFVTIKGPPPSMREDVARVGMGTADLRHRGEFDPWSATLTVKFNANVLSAAQVVNLFQTAGFAVGIGDWRPERDGIYGRFHVASENEA